MKKIGRNDPCPCGSGKKFKKCCESKMIGGRFKATKVDAQAAPSIQKASELTSLFQTSTAAIPKKTAPPEKEEKPSSSEEPPPKDEKTLQGRIKKPTKSDS